MRYRVGDKVRVKSLDWYDKNKDENGCVSAPPSNFLASMSDLCGAELTIETVYLNRYRVKENTWSWTDEMLERETEENETETDIVKAARELERAGKQYKKAKEKLKQLL